MTLVVLERITAFFGHVSKDGLGKLIIQGRVEGSRSRGRSPTKYTDHIVKTTVGSVC